MAWQTPKQDWKAGDVPAATDFNRIEGNVQELQNTKETPAGAQAKVDAHESKTSTHGATSAATANRIIIRDSAGRAKVAAPSASDDIARKAEVDAVQANLTSHMNNKNNPHAVTAAQIGAAPSSHVGSGRSAHATATTSTAGFMSAADKTNLNNLIGSNHGYFVELASGVLYYHENEFSNRGNENGYGRAILRITLPLIPAYATVNRDTNTVDDVLSMMSLVKRLSITKLTWTANHFSNSYPVTARVTYQWDNESEVVFSTRNLTETFQTFTENLNLSESNFTNRKLTIRIYHYGKVSSSSMHLKDIRLEGTIIGKVVR